jgi:aryl-alcohol dehydrogenase-like predicted oxidoreductase
MDYTTLGASGLHVSRACLGAMMFGHSANAPTNETGSLLARRGVTSELGPTSEVP